MLPTFHGLANEDSLSFIMEFYLVVQTFPLSGVSEDDLRIRCFSYCFKDRAKSWLLHLLEGSLRTWEDVNNIFMTKYCSSQKTIDLRNKICIFSQMEGELIHEAWERFKLLHSQCPHHHYSLALQV